MELWPYLDLVTGPTLYYYWPFFGFLSLMRRFFQIFFTRRSSKLRSDLRRAGRASGHAFFLFDADGMGAAQRESLELYVTPHPFQQHEELMIHVLQKAKPPEFPFHHQICKSKSVRRFKFIINNLLKQQLPFDRSFGLKETADWYHLHTGSEVPAHQHLFCFRRISYFSEGFIIISNRWFARIGLIYEG